MFPWISQRERKPEMRDVNAMGDFRIEYKESVRTYAAIGTYLKLCFETNLCYCCRQLFVPDDFFFVATIKLNFESIMFFCIVSWQVVFIYFLFDSVWLEIHIYNLIRTSNLSLFSLFLTQRTMTVAKSRSFLLLLLLFYSILWKNLKLLTNNFINIIRNLFVVDLLLDCLSSQLSITNNELC